MVLIRHIKKYKLLTLAFILVTINSCSSSSVSLQIENSQLKIVHVDSGKENVNSLSDLIDSIQYIPIKETGNFFIGGIDKIRYHNERFYVQDTDITKSLSCIDLGGNFLYQVSASGTGPNEFNDILNFTIDYSNNKLIIFSTGKVLFYDLGNGNFLREERDPNLYFGTRNTEITPLGNFISYYQYIQPFRSNDGNTHNLYFFDEKMRVTGKGLQYDSRIRPENITASSVVFSTMGEVSDFYTLTEPYNDTLYHVYDDKIVASVYVSFSDGAMPNDFIDKYLTAPMYSSGDVRNILVKEEIANMWFAVLELDRNLFFYYQYGNHFYQVSYDKNANKVHQSRVDMNNDIDGIGYDLGVNKGNSANFLIADLAIEDIKTQDYQTISLEPAFVNFLDKNDNGTVIRLTWLKSK